MNPKAVPWFEIDSLDMYNLRAHLEQTPAQMAYIGEQFAEAEKNFRDAEDRYVQVRGRKTMEARTEPQYRIGKDGSEECFNMTDSLAVKWADQTPEVIHAAELVQHYRKLRDQWAGYREAMKMKSSFLLVLGGMARDENDIINRLK